MKILRKELKEIDNKLHIEALRTVDNANKVLKANKGKNITINGKKIYVLTEEEKQKEFDKAIEEFERTGKLNYLGGSYKIT